VCSVIEVEVEVSGL